MYKRTWAVLATLVLGLFLLMPAGLALADGYDVSAKVPAPLPPDVPVVTTPGDNSVIATQTVEIVGTCPIVVPPLIVVIERDGEVIGSGTCSPTGMFSITVSLVLGVNVLRVKFMTITGESGGYGDTLNLTYDGESIKTSTPPKVNVIDNSLEAAGPLLIGLDYDFITYTTTQVTPVTVSISGGRPPYRLFVGWGDNSTKTYTVKTADTLVISHQYRSVPELPMKLLLRVQDADGTTTQVERALVSFEKPHDVPASSPLNPNGVNITPLEIWSLAAVGAALVAVISYSMWFSSHTAQSALKGKLRTRARPTPKKRIK